MEPLLKLPDVAPAPQSIIGDLAKRLVNGDWTVIQPLRDALQDAGRLNDLYRFDIRLKGVLARAFIHLPRGAHVDRRLTSKAVIAELVDVLWFDLFDADASINAMAETCKRMDTRLAEQQNQLRLAMAEQEAGLNAETNFGPPVEQETL